MSRPPLPEDRALPAGVVTFLMTDVEGSGAHWGVHANEMTTALRELDASVIKVVGEHEGIVIKPRGEGDSHFAVFPRPSHAVLAACELQAELREHRPGELDVLVRIAVHTGEIVPFEGDYYGVPVVQAARLRSVAHGGQIVVSRACALLAEVPLADRVRLRSLGHHKVRDFPRVEEVFQAGRPGCDEVFPPLRTESTHGPAVMTVVLLDICRASAVGRDAADPADVQRRWMSMLQRIGEAHDAASLKLLGDGCLIVFEDPLTALAFAERVRTNVAESGLDIRSGVAAGRVELVEGEVIGQAVFVAAELMGTALPGQIVMTAMFRDLAAAGDAICLGPRRLESTGRVSEVFAV